MAKKLTAKLEIGADGSAAVSAVKAVDAALDKVAGTATKSGRGFAQAAIDAQTLTTAQRKGEQAAASLNKIYTELRAQVGGPLVAAQQKYAGTLADLQRAEAQLTNAQRSSIVIQGQLSRARADATTALANETAAAQKGAGSVSALSGVYGGLRTAVLGYASIAGATAILSQGDQYQTLVAQLKAVTGSQNEFNVAYSALVNISKTNGTELGANTQLYARLSRATAEAGVTQTQLLEITSSVNSALRINSATAAESGSAILQLSQAFGSGRLGGEEFNAVNEAAPAIMDALARSLNVPRGSLKKLAEECKLTTEVLVQALSNAGGATDRLAAEAEKVPLGLNKAIQNLKTSSLEYIGQADAALGATQTLAAGVNFVSENLGGLVRTLGIAAVGYGALTAAKSSFVAQVVAGNGAIALSNAATTAWNGSVAAVGGTIGIVTAASAGLVVGLGVLAVGIYQNVQAFREADAAAIAYAVAAEASAARVAKANANAAQIGQRAGGAGRGQFFDDQGRTAAAALRDAERIDVRRDAGRQPGENRAVIVAQIQDLEALRAQYVRLGGDVTLFDSSLAKNRASLLNQTKISGELASANALISESLTASLAVTDRAASITDKYNVKIKELQAQQKVAGVDQDKLTAAINGQIAARDKEVAALAKSGAASTTANAVKRETVKLERDSAQAANFVAQAYRQAIGETDKRRATQLRYNDTLDELNKQLKEGKGVEADIKRAIDATTAARDKSLAAIDKEEAAQRRQKDVRGRLLDEMDEEIRLLGLTSEEREIEVRVMAAQQKGFDGNVEGLRKEIAARNEIREALEEQNAATKRLEENTKQSAENMARAFDEFAIGGFKNFKGFVSSIKDEFKRGLLEMLSASRQAGGSGGLFSGFAGLFGGGQGQQGGGGLLSNLLGSLGGGGQGQGAQSSGGFLSSFGNFSGGLLQNIGGFFSQGGAFQSGILGSLGNFGSGLATAGANIAGSGVFSSFFGNIGGGITSVLNGGLAAGFGQIAGAVLPIVGPLLAIAPLIKDRFSFKPTGATGTELSFGASGVSGFTTAQERRGGILGFGRKERDRVSALTPEAIQQGQDFAAQVTAQLQADAIVTGRSVATIISANFKSELDKNGKVIKEGGTIAGTFYAEGIAAFQSRLFAESRIDQLGPEASAIAAQWRRGTADVLASGAAFLVASAAAIKGGFGIAGESLADSLELVNKLKTPTESINEGFVRLVASSALLRDAIAATGGTAKLTGAAFTEFSASLVAGLGGLERANGIVSSVIEGIFTTAERQVIQENAARASATGLAAAAGFTGIASVAALKPRVQQALSGELSSEDARAVLEYAAAVSAFNRIVASGTPAVETLSDKETALARNRAAAAEQYATLSREIAAEVAQGNPRTLVQQIQAINRGALERVAQLQAEARAAGLAAAASGDLANAHLAAARTGAAAYATLERSVRSSISSLYPVASDLDRFIRQFGDVEFAITDGGTFRRPDAPADNGRFLQAAEIAAQVRQLAEVGGRNALDLIARFGAPLDKFAADLGINLANLGTAGGFDSFVQASRQLGVELPEFAARLGISIGVLADASSRVNDGFERALSGVEDTATRDALLALLRNLENSTTDEARSANTDALAGAIANLSPDLQSLFAPFLDQIDTTSAADLQLIEARELNGYQLIANGHLGAIAKGIEGITTATPQAESSRSLERSIAQAAEREIESTDGVALAVNNLAASVLASQAENRKLQGDMAALLQRLVRGG